MSCSPHPPAAYVEEYNEEAHTTLPETRQTANVAAKRSKPDIEKLKQAQGSREETSDSGHSTYTNAVGEPAGSPLKSKTDSHGEPKGKSKVETKADSPHLRLDTSVAMSKRKSDSGRKSAMTPKSAQKSSLRRTDGKSRDGRFVLPNDCTCEECISRARPSQESSRSSGYYTTPRTKPEAPAPPPPTKVPPSKPAKEVPVAQANPARPRSASTQSYRGARPLSFHAGLMNEQVYIPAVYLDPRPMSTFPAGSMFQPPPYPPPEGHYYPPNVQPISQRPERPPPPQFSFETRPQPTQRPQTGHWSSELQPPPNQPIMYSSSPLVEYPQQMYYPAHFPMSQSLPHRPVPQPPFNLVGQGPPHNEDWYLMPPPPPPPPRKSSEKHQRPTIRHAATAAHPTAHHEGRRIRADDGQQVEHLERRPMKTSPEKHERPRRPPVISRSSYSSTTEKPLPQYPPPPTRIRLEPNSSSAASAAAKQRRRASYYGHETQHDLLNHVEAYQAAQTPHIAPYPPRLTSDSLKLIRKKTNHTSSSDAGSFVSGEGRAGSWDDLTSRRSLDRRSELKTRTLNPNGASIGDGEGVTVRFNASQNVNLDLTGDGVETRTISLRQSGESEGGMELSIGGLDRGGSVSMGRERSWRGKSSYIDVSSAGRELEYARSVGREGDREREKEKEREKKEKEKRAEREKEEEKERDGHKEKEKDKERRAGASRSRRSSRSGHSGRAV